MDRKGILIIFATVALAVGWHVLYYMPRARENAKRYEEFKKQQAGKQATEPPPSATAQQTPQPAPQPAVTPEPPKTAPSAPEERKTVSSEVGTVEYIFTN